MPRVLHRAVSLSTNDWRFAGYTGEDWRFRNAFVSQEPSRAWHEGSVPGCVQWDLLRAGRLRDPYFGEQSLDAEWVSQRQWVYATAVEVPAAEEGSRTTLVLDGTDYEADVFLDGDLVASSRSLFVPTEVDVTGRAGERRLAVVLYEAPAEQSQIGYSPRVRTYKPRMGYGWDFAPRLVHVGIWGDVRLVTTGPARLSALWARPVLAEDGSAQVHLEVRLDDPESRAQGVAFEVTHDGAVVARATADAQGSGEVRASVALADPLLWWTNGEGEQPLYRVRAVALVDGDESDAAEAPFGIRTVRLVHNTGPEGVRDDALPYTLEVNGRALFTKGWNWVPVDAMYGRGDLAERYADLVALARDAGVNLLRVWGGGLIERDLFFDLCDRAGILVWQEVVQSSSGLDNEPPTDAGYLAGLVDEARAAVVSRRSHPSLALWCGGNELEAGGRPIEADHPNIAALQAVVAELDPDRPFVPSSPSGPVFYLDQAVAQGRSREQHDVHGPWDYRGPVDTYAVYDGSAALLHSEFGTPGAISRASLDRFVGAEQQWPPDASNPVWVHHGSWWLQRPWVEALFGPVEQLDDYVLLSQWVQADVLGYALDANRRRWPECSGTMPWQLNEPWPNAHCTSAIDYYLRPKPAYWAARDAYARATPSLRHGGLALAGGPLRATVHVCADDHAAGEVAVSVHDLDGRLLHEQVHPFSGTGSVEVGALDLDLGGLGADVVVVRVETRGTPVPVRRHYAFSAAAPDAQPFRALYEAAPAKVDAEAAPGSVRLRNDGPGIALFPVLDVDDDSLRWSLGGNAPVLLPGEAWETTVTATRRRAPLGPHVATASAPDDEPTEALVTVKGWNVAAVSVVVPLGARP